jgi:Spy/CpxP family protein refolding chaperone
MKKLMIAVFVMTVAAPVLAQEGPPDGMEGPPPIVEAAHNRVVAFLELTDEQVVAWDEMYQIHREAEQPLKEQMRELQEEIDALFESGDYTAEEVGELTIERRLAGEALAEVHLIYHEGFVALLDEEQLGRLGFIARADRVQEIIPAFKLFELIRRR